MRLMLVLMRYFVCLCSCAVSFVSFGFGDQNAVPVANARSGGERPNILFLIADDWGWNHAGAMGCKWVRTPTFDRIAREGVLFKNCFTSNPKCSPCRATILTGTTPGS